MTNPFDFGRSWLESWEKQMGDTLEKLAKDEKFMKNMSQVFSQSIDMKSQLEKQLEKYLKNINMPTRDDLQRMLVYLQRIEEKLLDLEDRLEVMGRPELRHPGAGRPLPASCGSASVGGKGFDPCTCADGEDGDCPEEPVHKRQPAGFTNGKKLKNQAAGPKISAKKVAASKPKKPAAKPAPAKKGTSRR